GAGPADRKGAAYVTCNHEPRKHESTKRTNDPLTSVAFACFAFSWVSRLGPRVGCGQYRLAGDRQLDRERRADVFDRLHVDRSAVLHDDTVDHRQPEPRAAIALRREERLEDVPLDRFGHAAAGIADDEAHRRAGVCHAFVVSGNRPAPTTLTLWIRALA